MSDFDHTSDGESQGGAFRLPKPLQDPDVRSVLGWIIALGAAVYATHRWQKYETVLGYIVLALLVGLIAHFAWRHFGKSKHQQQERQLSGSALPAAPLTPEERRKFEQIVEFYPRTTGKDSTP